MDLAIAVTPGTLALVLVPKSSLYPVRPGIVRGLSHYLDQQLFYEEDAMGEISIE